jgi:hypothetical protein
MTIHDFIKKRKYLIWWVKDYDKLGPGCPNRALLPALFTPAGILAVVGSVSMRMIRAVPMAAWVAAFPVVLN